MQSFENRLAVVTGGGSGMGQDLAVQLTRLEADVAICDIGEEGMAETVAKCNPSRRVTTHICDVADEASLSRFRDEVAEQHETEALHLLFNNAGIGGGGSFVTDERSAWERTFDICWGGVYLGCRVFLPMLMAADEAHIVNTSSVNGFWASIGPTRPHTAYAAAKFAVKGFTEALITDLRVSAPHIKCSVVMPGHIGTGIVINSAVAHGAEVGAEATEWGNAFRNNAPTTSEQAATVILDGVKADQWRILIGDDAHVLDALVRDDPEAAYEPEFVTRMHAQGALQGLVTE